MKFLIKKWKNRPIYKSWESMPDYLLFILFFLSSLPAFYWAYVLKSLWTPYFDAINSTGFTFLGTIVTLIMLGLTLNVWFFGCIAKRTGGLVYDKWFK